MFLKKKLLQENQKKLKYKIYSKNKNNSTQVKRSMFNQKNQCITNLKNIIKYFQD